MTVFESSVPASQKKSKDYAVKGLWEIIGLCSENRTEHVHAPCGSNDERHIA